MFWAETIEVSVIFDQPIEDERVDFAGSRVLRENGIEIGGIPNRTLDQLIDLLGRAGANKENTDSYEKEKKDGRDEENSLGIQKGFPFIDG